MHHKLITLAALAWAAVPAFASPYSDINAASAKGPVKVHMLRNHMATLEGSGGNITVLSGPDGFVLADCGIGVSQAEVQAALRTISTGRLRLAIVTHWHWDHADGGAWMRHDGADVIASKMTVTHLKSTIRVVEWDHTFTPTAQAGLPNVPIAGSKTLQLNGETIEIRSYKPGHTDGDLSIYFRKADVLAVGDTFWNGQYPFIDHVAGGSIDGAIRAANTNIALAGPRTIIVPGHGPLGDRTSQIAFRDMLVTIRESVARLKAKGMTADQVVAARPTAAFDAKGGQSLISGALFTRLVYGGV